MKIASIALCASALLFVQAAFAQPDTSVVQKERKKVLIAKGDSYLENAVASQIVDSLSKQDVTVAIIPLKDLNKENRRDYGVVVLFNAVKRNQINSTVNKYIKTTENYGTHSNLLILDVFGEKWKGEESTVDAVTTSTKILKPEPIVSRVLANIRSALLEK